MVAIDLISVLPEGARSVPRTLKGYAVVARRHAGGDKIPRYNGSGRPPVSTYSVAPAQAGPGRRVEHDRLGRAAEKARSRSSAGALASIAARSFTSAPSSGTTPSQTTNGPSVRTGWRGKLFGLSSVTSRPASRAPASR